MKDGDTKSRRLAEEVIMSGLARIIPAVGSSSMSSFGRVASASQISEPPFAIG
jgi:hypothetical protein